MTKKIVDLFKKCQSQEEVYQKIIHLGKTLHPLTPPERESSKSVSGCQSKLLLFSHTQDKHLYFKAESDALISAGLAALLIMAYSGKSPESIIQTSPLFLEEIGLSKALSPSRSNGLASLLLEMKREAVSMIQALNK